MYRLHTNGPISKPRERKFKFPKITEEKIEQIKQDRIDYKNNLSSEKQLGFFVGEYIISHYLPTLSTSILKTRKVIQVNDEDSKEHEKLDKEWYSLTEYGDKRNESTEELTTLIK